MSSTVRMVPVEGGEVALRDTPVPSTPIIYTYLVSPGIYAATIVQQLRPPPDPTNMANLLRRQMVMAVDTPTLNQRCISVLVSEFGLSQEDANAVVPSQMIPLAEVGAGVTSWNTRSGDVVMVSGDVTAALAYTPYDSANPSNYVNAPQAAAAAPVNSVAGRIGSVTLTHGDITDWTSATAPFALAAQVMPIAGGDFTGPIGVPSPGIHFNSMSSASANFQFAWQANRIIPFVNGIAQSSIAYTNDIPAAATTPPLMNGTAAAGTAATWSASDHVHPTDTTRYAASNPSAYINLTQARTGVTDGTDAAAGQIGEFMSAQRLSTAGLTLTSGTATGLTAVGLTAGDWDVWGSLGLTLTNNNTTEAIAWINPASGNSAPSIDQMGGNAQMPIANNQSAAVIMVVTPMRVSVTALTQVTLGTSTTFSGGTHVAWGKIMARRRR